MRPLPVILIGVCLASASSPFLASAQGQTVRFQRQTARSGDVSVQQVHCVLDLEMSIRQAGQIVQAHQQQLQRKQSRRLVILSAGEAAPQRAQITYDASSVAVAAGEQTSQSQQAVAGKTYLLERRGQQLLITDPDGQEVPDEERAIVAENMGSFGLPNPIAQFFHGQTVRVGQTLNLPAELARDLVGFTDAGQTISKFRMKLSQLQPAEDAQGSPIAVFLIQLHADDPSDSGVSMKLQGQMSMEVQTCRSRFVQLSGPVNVSETHGPEGAQYEVHSQGDIRVAVQASYRTR